MERCNEKLSETLQLEFVVQCLSYPGLVSKGDSGMSGNAYLVMRSDGAGFETVGPRSTAFDNFDAADAHARKMLDQHNGQRFVVCRAVAAYEVEQVTSVKLLAEDSCENKSTPPDTKNILPMPSLKAS